MKIKIQDRQTGKTHDIVQELKKDKKAIMIVASEIRKHSIREKYSLKRGKRIFTITEVMNQELRGRNYSKAYVDEIGCCMAILVPNIEYGTHTNYEVNK